MAEIAGASAFPRSALHATDHYNIFLEARVPVLSMDAAEAVAGHAISLRHRRRIH
jgi:hypothetical protein